MSSIIKVRNRTTNKIHDALVDPADYERLKDNNYLTDKNSPEPFRETNAGGKRQRTALKRDVMNFSVGDPRRVCYADKSNIFDCRKANLQVTEKTTGNTPVVKLVKTVTKNLTKAAASVNEAPAVVAKAEVKAVAPKTVKTAKPKAKTTAKPKAKAKTVAKTVAKAAVIKPVVAAAPALAPVQATQIQPSDIKQTLASELGMDALLGMISVDDLLHAWASSKKAGLKKQA
jgi:hypothetical protein